MDSLLQGIKQVCTYIDDILVTGENESEHLKNLDEVLKRLKEAGVTLKRSKCYFLQPEVEYLGHKISKAGLSPTDAKVRAILEAPAPENVFQLRSFLGLLNYYGRFLPSLSSTLAPLHTLLTKGKSWSWEKPQQVAFGNC
jgi:MoaA/NifB/PqqE/SkfB family radical SAM enzyme